MSVGHLNEKNNPVVQLSGCFGPAYYDRRGTCATVTCGVFNSISGQSKSRSLR